MTKKYILKEIARRLLQVSLVIVFYLILLSATGCGKAQEKYKEDKMFELEVSACVRSGEDVYGGSLKANIDTIKMFEGDVPVSFEIELRSGEILKLYRDYETGELIDNVYEFGSVGKVDVPTKLQYVCNISFDKNKGYLFRFVAK